MPTLQQSQRDLAMIPFDTPLCTPGQIVLYYRDCDFTDPQPAIVMKQTGKTVNLNAFIRDCGEMVPVPHARHRDDPVLQNPEMHENGAWAHSEDQEELERLRLAVTRLATEVQELKKRK